MAPLSHCISQPLIRRGSHDEQAQAARRDQLSLRSRIARSEKAEALRDVAVPWEPAMVSRLVGLRHHSMEEEGHESAHAPIIS